MVLTAAGRLQKVESEETKALEVSPPKDVNEVLTRLWLTAVRADGYNVKSPPALYPFSTWPVLLPFLHCPRDQGTPSRAPALF